MKNAHYQRISATVTALAAVVLFAAAVHSDAGPPSAAAQLTAMLLQLGPATGDCPTQCEISPCPTDQHQNISTAQGTNTGTVHTCQFSEGGCLDHRCQPEFGEGNVDLDQLASLLRAVDGAELQAVAVLGGRLQIQRERGAAQIIGCSDRVILNVPLSEEQLGALTLP
jgi:hypothetical protein